MSSHNIQAEIKKYLIVFAGLLFLTVVTVGISYLHLNTRDAVILALIVASIKGGLVACFFMHLISEQKFIYVLLSFTAVFFISMMYLTINGYFDTIKGTEYYVAEDISHSIH